MFSNPKAQYQALVEEERFLSRIDRGLRFFLILICLACVFVVLVGFSFQPPIKTPSETGIGHGFGPVQRMLQISPSGQAPRYMLVAEWLKNNWLNSDSTHISTWFDSSGNGYDASNTVLANQLKEDDYGVTRDSRATYLQTSTISKITLAASCSFVIKWRYNTDDSNYYSVFYFGNPLSGSGWMDSEFGKVGFRGIQEFPVVATAATDLGKTFTTVITTNGLVFNAFQDGILCATRNSGVLSFDSPGYFTIGNSHNSGWALNYGTQQSIRAIWIYNRILTPNEISGAASWTDSI